MRTNHWVASASVIAITAFLGGGDATAQQITGVPGSPEATTTIDGRYLPPPPQPFKGEINLNAAQSTPYWPARVVPPKGAPNILLIMTDDVGFGAPSDIRRRHPDADLGSHRRRGAALYEFPFDGLVLADARGADHRTQSSFGRIRRRRRAGDGVPRLQQHPSEGQHYDRPNPARRMVIAPPGSARTTTRRTTRRARPGLSISGRSVWASNISMVSSVATPANGSQTFSAIRQRFTLMSGIRDWNLITAMADDAIHWLTQSE